VSDPTADASTRLVAAGADPSIADTDGVTALEHARASGHDDIVRLLSAATS